MRLHCRGHLPPRPSSLVPPPSPFYRHAAWSCWPGSPRGSLFSCFALARLSARAQVGHSGPQTAAVLAAFVCGRFLFCPTSSPACSARPASGVVKYNALPQPNPLTGAGRQSVRRRLMHRQAHTQSHPFRMCRCARDEYRELADPHLLARKQLCC